MVTWGSRAYGGNSDRVKEELSEDVQEVIGSGKAMAAIKADGSVITWGSELDGGDSDAVMELFRSMLCCAQILFRCFLRVVLEETGNGDG